MNKIIDNLSKCLSVVFLCLIIFIVIIGNVENALILVLTSIFVIYFFVKKIRINNFGIFLLLFSLLLKTISIIIIKIPIFSDYGLMYNASLDVLNGDFSFSKGSYFTDFGYQTGHVLYQALVLKMFNSVFVLKFLNCVYSSIICLLIYLFGKKIVDETTARFVSLFYVITLYPMYLNSILGNQQLSIMLILLGIYIFLTKKDNVKNLILIGLLLGFGNIERPEAIIYLATIFIYILITEKMSLKSLKILLVIIIAYFSVNISANFLVKEFQINSVGLKNTNPYWKFVTGLNIETSGKYSFDDQNKYIHDKNLEKKIIFDRLTDYKNFPKLIYKKICVQWLYYDLDETFNVTSNTQFNSKFINILVNFIKLQNVIILLVTAFGYLKNRESKIEKFFKINILIYFGVYLLIEVNARYYYNPQISIMILSMLGFSKIFNFLNKDFFKNILKKCEL